jgi:uncharacterized cupin superfamily protein
MELVLTEPRRFNLFSAEVEYNEQDPEGCRAGEVRIGPPIGASAMGATIYELPEGQGICAYHYEYGNEEWVLVLEGKATLRHPGGETELEPGDVVCFPEGPEGAHKVLNKGGGRVRVLMLSTKHEPSVAVYPDSDKIGVWPGHGNADQIMVRRESNVDYWDREV